MDNTFSKITKSACKLPNGGVLYVGTDDLKELQRDIHEFNNCLSVEDGMLLVTIEKTLNHDDYVYVKLDASITRNWGIH